MTTQMFERKCLNCDRIYPADTVVCIEDGTQLAAILTHSLVGDTLGGGKYELMQELGRGGMGVVFRGKHRLMDRVVAIKMLIDDLGRDETALARFHVEAKAAAALSHTNIIHIYDFDVSPHGFPYIVMDYLEGTPLDAILEKETRMEWRRALPLFTKVCDALGHAHRRQVVHRDIKPSNIMIVEDDDGEERPIVLDFGIAKLFTQAGKAANRLTRTGEIFGSPLYMSPEQCMGQPIDPRSDIYSLGCLMHETLTGKAPYERSGFLQVILAHINAPLPTLEDLAPDLIFPPGLSDVLAKAIAKNLDDRFESMQEFKKALAAVDMGDPCAFSGSSGLSPGANPNSGRIGGDTVRSGGGGGAPIVDDSSDSEFQKLLAGAEDGDVESQYDLGWSYRKGESGAPKDLKMAFYWMLRAAQQGKTAAMNVISDMYQDGEGVLQDYKEAFSWRKKSAEAGDVLGQWNLGYMYSKGEGCELNEDLCAYWYRAAAEQGHDSAQSDMGWCYATGFGVESSDTESYEWYLKAANQGNKNAMTKVARALRWGWGVDENLESAVHWYTLAADLGNTDAQFELALMLFSGLGCRQDRMEGQRRLRLAAEQGNAEALNHLGLSLEFGWNGTPINLKEAVSCYRRAAQQNESDAEYNLGAAYEFGTGVDSDAHEAFKWYRRSAEDGSPAGMYALSRFLLDGTAGDANKTEGAKWLLLAVEKENSSALFRLSEMLTAGEIVDDKYDADKLLRSAADADHMEAQYKLGMKLIEDGQKDEGLVYLKKAADAGFAEASEALAGMQ